MIIKKLAITVIPVKHSCVLQRLNTVTSVESQCANFADRRLENFRIQIRWDEFVWFASENL